MRLLFSPDKTLGTNRFRDIDLYEIVTSWTDIYHASFKEKNIKCYIEPASPWTVRGVKEYLEVAIKNVIDNAVKYSFDATNYDEPGKFVVKWDNFRQRISFINFGVPIDREEIESKSIHDFSARGGRSDDRGRLGRGVGMFLVDQIVSLHDAKLDIRSSIQNPEGRNEFARNEISITF
ncbi:MAG: HAMP domain-containing histidine kinase, partial [Kamptonema sp. SIO4C4]|nr:HAMP domain-containing histidine kinase [Kamptonema sp. SIO4C4]